jgi:hypothetical protein
MTTDTVTVAEHPNVTAAIAAFTALAQGDVGPSGAHDRRLRHGQPRQRRRRPAVHETGHVAEAVREANARFWAQVGVTAPPM